MESKGLLLTDGKEKNVAKGRRSGISNRSTRITTLTRASLPTNLYTMSAPQLRAVCAAHGFTPKATTASGIVKVVFFGGTNDCCCASPFQG